MPHTHESLCYTVEVFVIYNGKVLLRKHDKYKIWLSIGGHIESGEDPNQAAIREVKEEVGLKVKLVEASSMNPPTNKDYRELIPPRFTNCHRVSPTHEHVTLVYFARAQTDRILNEGEEQSEECKWFTKEDIDSGKYDLKDHIKFYAKEALRELSERR